ncbi:MAG: hypothetical protein ACI4TE_06785 [Alphaproteobacteria bacterium]
MTVYIKVSRPQKSESAERPVGDMATRKMLRAYLNEAVRLTSGKSKAEAKKILQDYHQQADTQALKSSPDALKVVEAKEKSLKEKASSFGLKTKINYASDADISDISDVISMGVGAVATSMLAPIAAADPQALSAAILTAATAYTVTKAAKNAAAELSASKTPEQKKQAREYATVKHAQLALKLLKKEIEAPLKAAEKAKYKEDIAKLFAAGYGQPSGGLVQAPMTAGAPVSGAAAPKAEPVKEEKKSYWQEAKEMYARFGNPGGGMVHNDLPAKDEKAAESVKAEPAKEEKKSYWQEAKEMYARFGNPGGGMVHNDLPAKDEKAAEPVKAEPAKEEKKSYWQEVKETYARFGNPGGGMVHNDLPAADKKEPAKNDAAARAAALRIKTGGR